MLTILDGRKNFFQWDTEQKLIVSDELVKEIHFSNAVTNPALVCEVFEEDGNRVVNVPNILLQQDWNIKAYGCCDLCVRQYAEFEVIRRNKPADYVYTETEIKRYEDLESRIEALEQNGGGGAVASVNGKTGAVILTASDVGALSTSGGTINGVLNLGNTANTTASTINVRKKISDTQYMTGSITASGSDFKIQNSVSTKRSGSTTQYTTATNSILIGDNDTSVSKPILFTTTAAKEDTRDSLSVYSKAEVDALIPEVSGAVNSVNNKTGDVVLNAEDVGAVKKTGDTMTGSLRMGDGSKWVPLYLNYKVNGVPYEGELALDENRVTLTKRTDGTAYNKLYLNDNNTTLMKPLTVSSGGTEATTAAGARTNLDVYSKQETDAAILSAIGGDNERFELIENIVLEEETAAIERNKEPNGKAYDFKEMIIYILNEAYEKQGSNLTWQMIFNGDGSGIIPWIVCQASNYQQHLAAYVKIHKGRCFYDTAASINGMSNTNVAMNQSANSKGLCEADNLRQFRLSVYQNTMRAGTTIKIYGVRNNA